MVDTDSDNELTGTSLDDMTVDDRPASMTTGLLKSGKTFFRRGGSQIVVNDRYNVFPTERYTEFEHAYAEAFLASDVNENDTSYVAVIMKGRYAARWDMFSSLSQLDNKSIVQLKDWGNVWWPDEKRVRFALVFRKPAGKKIMPNLSAEFEVFNEDMLRFSVIKPVFQLLREMYDKGMYHGCVNPMNIYRVAADASSTVLGECLSSAPGAIQPAQFEPVERAMCDPHGKGAGTIRDDIYALGMSVAVLARGYNPLRGRKDLEIIDMKEDKGSFSMMTEGLRMTPGISEFLRGTLTDDSKTRWGFEEVAAWLDGTRLPPKQKGGVKRAGRAFEFGNKKYWYPRSLAADLVLNPAKSAEIIENGSISQWLSRALGSQEMADALLEAITKAQMNGRGEGYADRLVAFTSMALDPASPIRYRGLNVMPQGIGWAMSYAFADGRPIQGYAEIIRDRYAWIWLGYKENNTLDTQELIRTYDNISKLITRRGIEFGVERCLYELCRCAPCMSEKLQNYYVLECDDLLKALDDIGEDAFKERRNIIEKHVVSFMASHDKKDLAGIFRLIESVDKIKSALAVVTLFRDLQFRYYRNPLPGLAKWLRRYCEPVVERYHNKFTREDILDKLDKTIQTGDLNRIIGLIDNSTVVRKDMFEFQKAQREYSEMDVERSTLKNRLLNDKFFGRETGRQFASIVSLVLAALLTAAIMMIRVTV